MITDFSYTTQWALTDLFSRICCNRLLVDLLSYRLSGPHIRDCLATPASSALNYWWIFSPCQLQGQIDWHVSGGLRRIDHPCAEARHICSIERTLLACCVCPQHGTKNLCWHTSLAHPVGPTIVMAVHNNDDILMLHYEDIPDGDKGIISKALEEF